MINAKENILKNLKTLSEEEFKEWFDTNYDKISEVLYQNKELLLSILPKIYNLD